MCWVSGYQDSLLQQAPPVPPLPLVTEAQWAADPEAATAAIDNAMFWLDYASASQSLDKQEQPHDSTSDY